jgi:hypothetical protein
MKRSRIDRMTRFLLIFLLFNISCVLRPALSLGAIFPLPHAPWMHIWPLPNDIEHSFRAWIAATCDDQTHRSHCTHNVAIIAYRQHLEHFGQLFNHPQPGEQQGVAAPIIDQWCIVFVIEHQPPPFFHPAGGEYGATVSTKQGVVVTKLQDASYSVLPADHPRWSPHSACSSEVERAEVDAPW